MPDSLRLGDRVRVHLYTREGLLIGSIEGKVSDFAPDTEVAPGVRKNLVWVTGIEGYERPNDLGQSMPADEGWFADTDVEKIEEGRPRLFSN
jgi:hypothetical protein